MGRFRYPILPGGPPKRGVISGDYCVFCRIGPDKTFVATVESVDEGLARIKTLSLIGSGEYLLLKEERLIALAQGGSVEMVETAKGVEAQDVLAKLDVAIADCETGLSSAARAALNAEKARGTLEAVSAAAGYFPQTKEQQQEISKKSAKLRDVLGQLERQLSVRTTPPKT